MTREEFEALKKAKLEEKAAAVTREIEVELKESGCRSLEQAEALNMATVASLVMSGAAEREASAGLHHNVDKPPTARQLATAASREPAAVGAADK